jgi:imidazolonepropionase
LPFGGAPKKPALKVAGKKMSRLPCIDDGWISIKEGIITGFGKCAEGIPQKSKYDYIIDAKGKLVFPSFCDSHTHLVYAGSREDEFVDKIKGMTYAEIAKRGGGILNSTKKVSKASEDELYDSAMQRLNEIARQGTGAVEIKSGYGLSIESELKMLRVIKKLKKHSPLTIKATFLGAHALPLKYKNDRKAYINSIINEMLPEIAKEKLADYCDVFCDKGFFTPEETNLILESAWKYGLPPKIHANELDFSGGVQTGVKNCALSVDHLEHVGKNEISAMFNSDTMPTLLPTTAFFLGLNYAPARLMIDAGLPVALASDYNPGTSPSGKMSFVLSLACIMMKMLPEEAINAATINSAYAMGISNTHGTITPGKVANLFITSPVTGYNFIPYSFGSELIETAILNGKVILGK